MIRIVADHKIPFLKGALEGIAQVNYLPGSKISRYDLLDADGLITRTRTTCNRELLEGSTVRFIASATIGYDHIDVDYCRTEGIRWTNAPGCNSSSVQQYIVSTLLYLAVQRKIDITRMTLGIVGVGNVGSKVAAAAETLGMNVLRNDPPRARVEGGENFVDLKTVLEQADIITLHVPLNRGDVDNTSRMVNAEFIQRMKKGAVLINTSRGGVVDEMALLEGIREGKFSDVILDVFENEPGINLEVLDAITLGTPHIAGYSLDGKANGTSMSVRAMSQFFNLGLDQWEPNNIPTPPNTKLYADAAQGGLPEVLWDLYRNTYDVSSDDQRLRNDPQAFESLRGDYPLRREPHAYSVRLFQGHKEITNQLEKLGFSVLADHCV